MGQWLIIVAAVTSVFVIIALGAVLRRVGWLGEEADRSLSKLIFGVLLPCLIFSVVSDNVALKQPSYVLLPPLVGFGTCVLGFGVALLVTCLGKPWHGLDGAGQRRTFSACVGIYNYGFVPIPLVELLFDDQTLGVLFVHNIGANLAIWTVGVMLLSGQLARQWWRSMLNGPMIAMAAALALNFLGAGRHLPGPISTAVDWLGQAAIPISLILIGATIADQLRSGDVLRNAADRAKVVGWACLLRLGLLPLAFLAIAGLLPDTLVELKRVIVIEAAMPSAVLPIVMSRHYQGEPATALRVVLSTSILSLITMPLWIPLGMRLVGLDSGG